MTSAPNDPIHLGPLSLPLPAADLALLFRLVAVHPSLFSDLQELLELLSTAAATTSPAPWLRATGLRDTLEFGELALPAMPPPGAVGDREEKLRPLTKACKRWLALHPLYKEFGRRLGGQGALKPRVLRESSEILTTLLDRVEPKALFVGTNASWNVEGVKLPEHDLAFSSRTLSTFYRGPALEDEDQEFAAAEAPADLGGGGWPARVVIFVATIGPGLGDESKAAFVRESPYEGLLIDALASTLTEGLAREVVETITQEEILGPPTPEHRVRRYHTGYGDWDLANQEQIFALLKPSRIGIELTPSFLMLPEKSVAGLAAFKVRASKSR